jgi:hypothetical protein
MAVIQQVPGPVRPASNGLTSLRLTIHLSSHRATLAAPHPSTRLSAGLFRGLTRRFRRKSCNKCSLCNKLSMRGWELLNQRGLRRAVYSVGVVGGQRGEGLG